MKAICTFCGYVNKGSVAICDKCGGSLVDAPRVTRKLPWTAWAPAIPVAAILLFQWHDISLPAAKARQDQATALVKLQSDHRQELQKIEDDFNRSEAEEELKLRKLLADERIVSGAAAAEKHADEWKRRQAHDPAFAKTLLEQTLLEVEQLGKDPSLTAETALKKVAERVTPPNSRIEVTKGDSGLIIRVAFRLAAVDPNESAGATRHKTSIEMRKEIEDITARVVKELFDYCGSRNIERLSVSCNRALIAGGDDEHLVMKSLYRASIDAATAAQVSNWRSVSRGHVAELLHVDHDLTASVMITHKPRAIFAEDADLPLEF